MPRPRIFVFDIDGVVRTFRPERMARRLRDELGLPTGTIEDVAFADPLARELVEGRMSRADWTREVARRVGKLSATPAHAASVLDEWASDIGQLVPETIALVDELRAAHPVFALTNGTDATHDELTRHGVLGHFVRVLNSAEIGVAKPERDCFAAAHRAIEVALERDVPSASVFFVDDRVENVAAASEFGWQGHAFTDAAHLRETLGELLALAD